MQLLQFEEQLTGTLHDLFFALLPVELWQDGLEGGRIELLQEGVAVDGLLASGRGLLGGGQAQCHLFVGRSDDHHGGATGLTPVADRLRSRHPLVRLLQHHVQDRHVLACH